MSFGKLYRELCNDSLSKPSTDTDYFDQRVEVMRMIGLGGSGTGGNSSANTGGITRRQQQQQSDGSRTHKALQLAVRAAEEQHGLRGLGDAIARVEVDGQQRYRVVGKLVAVTVVNGAVKVGSPRN